ERYFASPKNDPSDVSKNVEDAELLGDILRMEPRLYVLEMLRLPLVEERHLLVALLDTYGHPRRTVVEVVPQLLSGANKLGSLNAGHPGRVIMVDCVAVNARLICEKADGRREKGGRDAEYED